MTQVVVSGILAAAVATGGTFTVGYPTGYDRGSFSLGVKHRLVAIGKVFSAPENMTLSFGAASVTVTYNGTTTLPLGTAYKFQFDQIGSFGNQLVDTTSGVPILTPAQLAIFDLGSPGTADADGYFASADVTAAASAATALTGALVASGVGIADARTGRNVVAAWTGTAVLTVTGKDMYGNTVVESSASGTSLAGKKAFKKLTSFSLSADVTALTIGTGDVLGLPAYTPNAAMILKESEDGAAATAGTTVAGLTLATKPTATNADVRGTYDPNSACNGSKAFNLLVAVPDPTFLGATQYAG